MRWRWQRAAPAVTLLLLAPVVSEVLFGATRLSYLFVLVPQIMVWGCGALLIRETVRRWRRGWLGMILLGLALAAAEEFLIQQTSLAPLVGGNPAQAYGRALGVNWVWLLAMLGYETVWVVLIPVQLSELIFWPRRDKPWLGKRGLLFTGITFGIGCVVAWYAWTQRARPLVFHAGIYQPPWSHILIALGVVLALVLAAFILPAPWQWRRERAGPAPAPQTVAILAFMLALPWFALIHIAYGAFPGVPPWVPMAAGVSWAALALLAVARWSSRRAWEPGHRLALVSGGMVASMAAGFGQGPWRSLDLDGKVVFNALAVLMLAVLAGKLVRNSIEQRDG